VNKHSIRDYLGCELSTHASTFKETSYDDVNGEHLCQDESTCHVYNFDAYVRKTYDESVLPASPDAIHLGVKHIYFVEFKNRPARLINKENVQKKFRKGTGILQSLLSEFTPRDCKYNFCVVFKSQSKPRFFDSRYIERGVVRFELDALNGEFNRFYDHIITEDVSFFVERFKELRC
jgi:hypothetical protein